MITKNEYKLSHVRHDPMHCLAPGLFRSLRKGERKKNKLDITFSYGNETTVRFWGPEPLGVDDMRVLQGLVAMAATSGESGRGIVLSHDVQNEIGKNIREKIELKWDAEKADMLIAKGSYRQLAKELGYKDYDSGTVIKSIKDSIDRIWAMSVIVKNKNVKMGFRILSDYASNEKTGQLFVGLNPKIASAIVGDAKHTRLDMNEIRVLKSDPVRLLHQRLCGWIDTNKEGKVEMDTLIKYVWHDESCSAESLKKRKQTIKKCLVELNGLGWFVTEYSTGKWSIRRPKYVE